MREPAFLKLNSHRWKEFEKILQEERSNPDYLADLYVQLTDDLSYAQTYYPQSNTVIYLNGLASKVHALIYKNKKEKKSRFKEFWMRELPVLMGKHQKALLYSFLIFFVATCVGALSSAFDDSYVRLILGDDYVNMTLENISKNDPMAVYKGSEETGMFLMITMNNIKVSFLTFVFGVFSSFGTGYLLFSNGIMLGAFQYFFYEKGLILTSVLTIWIHGTLEISAIIIAGAAGIVMGNSLLFPGTFSRIDSFKKGAKEGMKIVVGLVPIFIAAGFLEGFATRHTEWPLLVKLFIIISSALLIVLYFIVYPIVLNKKLHEKKD